MTAKLEKGTKQLDKKPQENTTKNELVWVLDATEKRKRKIKWKINEMNENLPKGRKINTEEELISFITELQKELKPEEINWHEQQQLEEFGKLLKDKKLIEALWVENIVDCEMTLGVIIKIRNLWFSGDLDIEDIKKIDHEKIIEMSKNSYKYW